MAAAPSPLAQAHRPPRSDAGSDSESDSDEHQQQPNQAAESVNPTVQSVQERLAQLALIKEVDIDTSKLDALTPEVIANQATINIGQFCFATCLDLCAARQPSAGGGSNGDSTRDSRNCVVAPPTCSCHAARGAKPGALVRERMAKRAVLGFSHGRGARGNAASTAGGARCVTHQPRSARLDQPEERMPSLY